MKFDPTVWQTARQRLPLPHLMTKIGDGAFTKKNADCPFCGAKGGTWAVFEHQGRHHFKCHKTDCVANNPKGDVGHGEVGYLCLRKNLEPKEAAKLYLELAVPELLQEQKETKSKTQKKEKSGDRKIVTMSGEPVPENPPPPEPPKPNVWDALWGKLILSPRDRTKLQQQRGFSEATITKLGFKSNNQANRAHFESLRKDFPVDLLLSEGIMKSSRDGTRPNPQLVGWGLSRRARKDDEEDLWDWTEPPLIPYLNESGRAFYLRPHKGGVSKPQDDDDDEESCSSHVYCPFLLADFGASFDGCLVLCEGEFKAAALYQCGIPAIAIPGTSFVRNRIFKRELLDLLRRFSVTDLVICFDNEVKDDPKFQDRYKPDPWDRWDTPMWAEYIAIDLTREYFGPHKGIARIGVLPDNLRLEGKADFDSSLNYFVKKTGSVERGTAEAREVFQKVIADAQPHRQARDLFPSESRRIIECKLQRLFYKPLVSAGGENELKFANRLKSIGEGEVAEAFRSIIGCYYDRAQPDRDERKVLLAAARDSSRAVDEAKAAGVNGSEIRRLRLKARAAWEMVKGLPRPVSNFVLTCEFKLHTHDQKAVRLVKIRNRNHSGKSDGSLHRLTGAEMARGPEFMRWCYDTGDAVWKGGQRLLADLCEDMDHHSYLRDIYEVNYYGYHAESGIWFFGDCAFGPNGDLIEADANNIFWSGGIGYQVDSSIDERGTTFEQAAPLMLAPHGGKIKSKKNPNLEDLFHQLCFDLFSTIGDYDAWLMLGLIFAYAGAPELLRLGGHPAVWLYGKMSGGKTTIARWIMRIWGFKDLGGVGIDDRTTPVGMNRFLAQYSCLPVWFDEYRSNHNDPQKEAVLRGAFDRNSGAKGLADHSNRTRSARIFTTPIVTGEASSSDGATRSRYGHINVNDKRRLGDAVARFAKVQDDCRHYYLVGRFLMENRPKFISDMLVIHEEWMTDIEIRKKILNERVRFLYGVGWSAFVALSRMIGGDGRDEREGMEDNFKQFLFTHGEQALQDVISETFLTRFWTDVVSGLQRNKIKRYHFSIRFVTCESDGRLKMAQPGDKGATEVLYLAPNPIFDDYAQDSRSRGESPPLGLGDLRREMAKEPYWIPPPKTDQVRVHRAMINQIKTSCWVISLERDSSGNWIFPFGEDLKAILDHTDDDDEPGPRPPPDLVS